MCQIFCLVFLGSHNNPKFTYPFFSKQHLTISDNKHEQLMLYLYIYIYIATPAFGLRCAASYHSCKTGWINLKRKHGQKSCFAECSQL